MIAIIGESGSGKTTLVKNFIERNPKYHKIITYTTRPPRKDEKLGEDYYFVPEKTFQEMVKRDAFLEHTKYRDWSYGTAKADCLSLYGIACLTPSGFRAIKRQGFDITSVYLQVDRRSRLIQILARGDDIDEACRRSLSDAGQFDGVADEVDAVIDNAGYHMTEAQTASCLEKILHVEKSNGNDDENSKI